MLAIVTHATALLSVRQPHSCTSGALVKLFHSMEFVRTHLIRWGLGPSIGKKISSFEFRSTFVMHICGLWDPHQWCLVPNEFGPYIIVIVGYN